jgi:hypothetical protein
MTKTLEAELVYNELINRTLTELTVEEIENLKNIDIPKLVENIKQDSQQMGNK